MRFLSVAERELRAAARQKGTYRIRWISAAGAFALLLWLGWAFDMFQNKTAGPMVFRVFSVVIFFYCLFVGATGTADCISREKREGTLGLLFLTNLNSAEIVAGKLCANGLALFYSLLAFFPVLALPVLIGGITFGQFWRTVLALMNVLLFAMAAGFNASAVSVRQFTAVGQATGLALVFGTGLSAAAAVMGRFGCPLSVVDAVTMFSPLHTLFSAETGTRFSARFDYWHSLAAVAGVTWAWLALAAWRVGRSWRDQPKSVSAWSRFRFGERFRQRGSVARTALRRRLLEINPFFWLAGRHRVSAPIFMLLTTILVFITVWVAAPYFGWLFRSQTTASPVLGQLFAWLWTGLAIHALVLYYGAIVASQRLAEDKQVGALELVLVTPTSERSIARGLWLAYGRRMLFPVLVAVLVHCFFVWQVLTMAVLDPPGKLPPNVTAGQIFWSALFDQPIKGFVLEWHFGFMLRVVLLLLVALAASWVMLGWVGRWLGLRMKHPGFAPMTAVALALVPPTLLFSLVCYLCDKWHFFRMPERQWLPIMMWVGFVIALGNSMLLSAWAAIRLRRDFRTTVTGRYDTPTLRDRWRLGWRILLRFAMTTAALVVALALIAVLFYGYQNWHSKRAWVAFQSELKQKRESLDVSALLPGPVADNLNFARTPVFQNLVTRKNAETARLFDQLNRFDNAGTPFAGSPVTPEWIKQEFAPLDDYAEWIAPKSRSVTSTNLVDYAPVLLQALQTQRDMMRDVAAAAHLPFLQASTNRNALAVLPPNKNAPPTLERLHFLFRVRACALLAVDRVPDASEDLLTSLRLARLARQLPDARSSIRVQFMIVRSLQPLWEGLADLQWNDAQLATFQKQLAEFNLLADHTNAIRRVVLAYIEIWRAIPDAGTKHISIPQSDGGYVRESAWQVQPRAWWYDNCIQLYQAGQNAIARVDVAAGRVSENNHWGDVDGLPLESDVHQLFQQNQWMGNNPALVSFAQTAVNQAIIACALERYRLARGIYPESLDQLLPAYLTGVPRDISRGRPMFYLRHDNGSYELRGAGANGTIEQGKAASDDWLWSFTSPTNTPPVKKPKRK